MGGGFEEAKGPSPARGLVIFLVLSVICIIVF